MNGVDYSKALARERDNYQNTIQKDRAHSAKRLADNEERHEAIQKKQRENFEADRTELEGDYKGNVADIKERTRESLDNMKERFHKQNREEESRFHQEREVSRKDYDGRMRDIKNSYQRALTSEEKGNKAVQETINKRYNDNVDRLVQDRDKKLDNFQERMSKTGVDLADQYKREKEQLVRAHEDHLQNMYKDEATKRFELKEGLQKDLQRTKTAHAANEEQTQAYTRDKVRTLTDNFNERVSKMAGDYSKRNGQFVEAQAHENTRTNKRHQNEISEARSNYERELRNIDIERRRRDNGSGEFAEVVRRQQGLKDDQAFEDRIERLQAQNAEAQRNYNKHLDEANEGQRDTLRTESAEAAARFERQGRELTADKIVNVSNEREKAQKFQSLQQQSQHAERLRYEGQISQERNDAGKKMEKLKENFNKSLIDLQEKNEKFVEQLKQQTNEDKVKFINANSSQRNDEITDLRRNFTKLMDTTVNDYESRLAVANRENAQLKDELNQKVGFLIAEADQRVEQQTRLYEDKRAADQKANQVLMDHREANFRGKIRELSDSYQRKIDQLTYDAEMRLKHTVNDYEGKLKQQDALNAKNVAEKNNLNAAELKRLKAALEAEKAQIIAQYENQMNQLKLSHKQEQDKLNEYKSIS